MVVAEDVSNRAQVLAGALTALPENWTVHDVVACFQVGDADAFVYMEQYPTDSVFDLYRDETEGPGFWYTRLVAARNNMASGLYPRLSGQ